MTASAFSWSRVCTVASVLLAAAGCGDGGGDGADGDGDGENGDRVAVATVKMASCGMVSPAAFAALSLPLLDAEDLSCVIGAEECAEVLACVGMRVGGPGCAGPDTCIDEDTLSTCRALVPYEIDCSAWRGHGGPACLERTDGEARCGASLCDVEMETCDGTVLLDCSEGVLEEYDCRDLDCSETPEGADCASFSADTCEGPARCDGDVLVACESGVELIRDCATFIDGATCVTEAGGGDAFCGFASECDVDIGDPGDTCEGTSVRFCLLGRTVTVDCTEIGFAGCATDGTTGCR